MGCNKSKIKACFVCFTRQLLQYRVQKFLEYKVQKLPWAGDFASIEISRLIQKMLDKTVMKRILQQNFFFRVVEFFSDSKKNCIPNCFAYLWGRSLTTLTKQSRQVARKMSEVCRFSSKGIPSLMSTVGRWSIMDKI